MLLLAKAHSLDERGIPFLLFKPSLDTRDKGVIRSRSLGNRECFSITKTEKFCERYDFYNSDIKWLLIDEAQFLTTEQIDELSDIVDYAGINVACYGLRTDFTTHLFDGSKRLFEIADVLEEVESVCECGNKCIYNARVDKNGKILTSGEQIEVGAEDKYITYCRKCYKEKVNKN